VFSLEREVTDDIAQHVQAKLESPRQTGLTQARSVDPKVLDAYILGNYYLRGRGRGAGDEERKMARQYFQQAIDADPNFAPAYIGLASAHDELSQGELEDLIIARKAAEKAVELDSASSDARLELGQTKWEIWDWSGAEEDARRALVLNPNNADAHNMLADVLQTTGRLDEAWKEYQITQELDPNRDHLADALSQRGQFDQAIAIRQRIANRDPEDGYNHWALALSYAQKSMYQECVTEIGKSFALYGFPDVGGRLQRAYDQSGKQGALRQLAKEFEHLAAAKRGYIPGSLAQVYAALGDKDHAFYWLDQYRQHHDLATADPVRFFKTDPWFASLRSDPRFSGFLRRIGLPP
jgi:tetratricopeptide (TPR) repeat protein